MRKDEWHPQWPDPSARMLSLVMIMALVILGLVGIIAYLR